MCRYGGAQNFRAIVWVFYVILLVVEWGVAENGGVVSRFDTLIVLAFCPGLG